MGDVEMADPVDSADRVDHVDPAEQRVRAVLQQTGVDVDMENGDDMAFVSGIIDKALTEEQRLAGERGFTAAEWKKLTTNNRGARRFPLKVDHDKIVGRLLHTFVDDERNLCISAMVDRKTPEGRAAWLRVKNNDLDAFSVGFNGYPHSRYGETDKKLFNVMLEVSMTNNPKKKIAVMRTRCSNNPVEGEGEGGGANDADTGDQWGEDEIDAELHAAIEAAALKRSQRRVAAAAATATPPAAPTPAAPAIAIEPPVVPIAEPNPPIEPNPPVAEPAPVVAIAAPACAPRAPEVLEERAADAGIILPPPTSTAPQMADQAAAAPMVVDTPAPTQTATPTIAQPAVAQPAVAAPTSIPLSEDTMKALVAEAERAKVLQAQLDESSILANLWKESEKKRIEAEQEAARKVQQARVEQLKSTFSQLPADAEFQNPAFMEAMSQFAEHTEGAMLTESTTKIGQWALEQQKAAQKAVAEKQQLEQQLKALEALIPTSVNKRVKASESTDSSQTAEAQRGKKAAPVTTETPKNAPSLMDLLDTKKIRDQAMALVLQKAAAQEQQQKQQQQRQQEASGTPLPGLDHLASIFESIKANAAGMTPEELARLLNPAAAAQQAQDDEMAAQIDENEVKWSAAKTLHDATSAWLGLKLAGKEPRSVDVRNSNAGGIDLAAAVKKTWYSNVPDSAEQVGPLARIMFDDAMGKEVNDIAQNPMRMAQLAEQASYAENMRLHELAQRYNVAPPDVFEFDSQIIPLAPAMPHHITHANKNGFCAEVQRNQMAGQQMIFYQPMARSGRH
jgi:hypothetical protein